MFIFVPDWGMSQINKPNSMFELSICIRHLISLSTNTNYYIFIKRTNTIQKIVFTLCINRKELSGETA